MKNLKLNLKGLYGYRQSHLSRSPQPRDNREMSERRPSEERTLLAALPQRFARYAAMLLMVLTFGVGQMWGAEGKAKQGTLAGKPDTAYIITPSLSTQDTIFLKHEDINPAEKTWWEKYGGVIESLLAVLAGAGVSIFTGWLKDREEEKRFEQELHNKRQFTITDQGIQREHEIYYALLDIQNESDSNKKAKLLQDFKQQLDKAKLDMLNDLYRLANDMYVYFRATSAGTQDKDEVREQQMFETYYTLFTNA